ncbi:ECF transporter S component [Pseudoclavibacter sp. CFCC 13611]|uniref:ECF transporter S component n=1 Tax=Pseudoclavibacter sp. CFCC 13611 TaxID=2615178 RepID=UPI0013018A9E|nr:ECF transporter S component [Pseudoclavibacter sp. CFCC 13611]KAB1663583.1 ECF transporter S component [Pseudoclavibacter sp. CFCC 13611]
MKRVSTTYLLICAAIGVAGALILLPANWVSTVLFAAAPVAGMALAGIWLLPAVIALRLVRRPGAGVLTGLVSGIALIPASGYGFASVATNVWWAFFAEIGFLILAYRRWHTWQHYLGAALVGVLYPVLAAEVYQLWALPLSLQIAFFALCLASCVVGTWLGISVADRLARAGVARAVRR